ncbi:RHS repeat-associated core domain-containing protein, partial [Sphingomonas sp. URHD0057]|uniref:RHS repeat-associated core domain-containing protein n=1 Tax=Sphingomonas sp. URHD0057 TaxID=1380389 RepID=UPI0012DF2566
LNTYDEFGKPGASNIGRFQYTGQAWIPELALYYYKARFYAPHLGRFMQTDPVGYEDSPNAYNYVLGDPVNNADPTGAYVPRPPRSICNAVNTCDPYGSTQGLLLRRDAAIGGGLGGGGGGISCVSTPGSVNPGSGNGPITITGGSTTCTVSRGGDFPVQFASNPFYPYSNDPDGGFLHWYSDQLNGGLNQQKEKAKETAERCAAGVSNISVGQTASDAAKGAGTGAGGKALSGLLKRIFLGAETGGEGVVGSALWGGAKGTVKSVINQACSEDQ